MEGEGMENEGESIAKIEHGREGGRHRKEDECLTVTVLMLAWASAEACRH